jgi:hypothetical protein
MTDFSKASNLTVGNIDKHIYAQAEKLGIKNVAAPGNLKTLNICQIYSIARPIMLFVKSILFFSATWQGIVTAMMAALDVECPTSVPPAA